MDGQANSPEVQIENNRKQHEKEMYDILNVITRKSKNELTRDNKAFLQARVSYLTEGQRETYREELAEDLNSEPSPYKLYSRKELETRAAELNIAGAEDKKLYRTNQDLIDAIELAEK